MCELSVIMPVYNQERYIDDAVRSILRQTFSDFEFIIIDDGSTDRTIELIENFKDARIQVIRTPHRGFIDALRTGIESANGKWIARMDSDDICLPDRLDVQLRFLRSHPDCAFVTSFYGIVTPHNRFLTPPPSSKWHYLRPHDITRAAKPFCDPGTVFERGLAVKIGYDQRFKWEKTLWYGMLKEGKGAVLEEPLYFVRWRLGSVSRGQYQFPARLFYEMQLAYDPNNALAPKEIVGTAMEMKNAKKCIYYYSAVRDLRSVRDTLVATWRRRRLHWGVFRLLILALRLFAWQYDVYGPTGVRLFRTKSPFPELAGRRSSGVGMTSSV